MRLLQIYSYEDRHIQKGLLWRMSSVYRNTRDSLDDEGATDAESDPFLPDVPSFSHTELSVRHDFLFSINLRFVFYSSSLGKKNYICYRMHILSLIQLNRISLSSFI
uniref:Uncharacterized protein n=1 Tax=Heterorhabditis bacteriophora TaxID=37862 RepID=A0A1I7WB94_HETBA